MDGACVADVPGDPEGFKNADGIMGGKLYDKFWATETGFDQNDPNFDTISNNGDFFRCKQCHAWDNLANTASYISRGPTETRPNVTGVVLTNLGDTPQQLFDIIKNGEGIPRRAVDADLSTYDPTLAPGTQEGDWMPDFGTILTDDQIWNLVKYLKEETLDASQLYDTVTDGTYPTGTRTFENIGKDGDPVNGAEVYASNCGGCHGDDGTSFLVDGEFSVGSFARDKPYELGHKVKFGQLGTAMDPMVTDLNDIKDLFAALADANAFPDPAPVDPAP